MIEALTALTADPWRVLALTMMGSGLVVSGMITGYKVSWFLGINPALGSYAGLIVAVLCGVAYFTA
jgi:hypothetical protein